MSGASVSPAAASTTWSREARSRRAASDVVKPAGMCWTITVPAPRRSGSCGTRRASAAGPPVERGDEDERLGGHGRGGRGTTDRRGGAAAAGRRRRRGGGVRRGRSGARDPAAHRSRGGAHLVGELGDERAQRVARAGLGDEVERALRQRVDGAGAVGGRERGDDDHGDGGRPRAAQLAQHADAVAARHRQVERHGVGPQAAAQRERLVAVAGLADDVEAGVGRARARAPGA